MLDQIPGFEDEDDDENQFFILLPVVGGVCVIPDSITVAIANHNE
jgi:hypothetical protein